MEQYNNTLRKGEVLIGNSYKYLIEKVLGQGSFGITYLASVKMAGSLGAIDANIKVAIKEFFMRDINGRSDMSVTSGSKGGIYDEYKRKFTREAVNLSKLKHPNIIKVIESFEANNTVYYVMEYIGGGSLDDYIAKGNGIKEDEAVRIIKQIGSALSFMHNNKMLHLDLKPSNIMMKESGDIVLIDFGLSKQYDSKGEPESSTKVGAGTLGYAPIEQANYREGKGFPVTMDVYALGATMFKMLTGVRPPEASDILNDGFPLHELQEHGISDTLSACIAKAMAPTKKDRCQSVSEFVNSLDKGEMTIIDIDVADETQSHKNNQRQTEFDIRSDTGSVKIEYSPMSPVETGRYIASINSSEIHITSTMSTYCIFPISEGEYSKYLSDLRDLDLSIRDEQSINYNDYSEEPEKLVISLYDNEGGKYATYWIGGGKNEYGNIFGDLQSLNLTIQKITPQLKDFLFSEYKQENEKFVKNERGEKLSTSRLHHNKSFEHSQKVEPSGIRYRWILALCALIVETCFAYIMLSQSRESNMDSDSRLLAGIFVFASLCFTYYLFNARKSINASTWWAISFVFTLACFVNSLMLPMWTYSLTGVFFLLSLGLSVVSSFTLLIKKSV